MAGDLFYVVDNYCNTQIVAHSGDLFQFFINIYYRITEQDLVGIQIKAISTEEKNQESFFVLYQFLNLMKFLIQHADCWVLKLKYFLLIKFKVEIQEN